MKGQVKVQFGTNLPTELYEWVKQQHEITKVPVNGIIEFAVTMYKNSKDLKNKKEDLCATPQTCTG